MVHHGSYVLHQSCSIYIIYLMYVTMYVYIGTIVYIIYEDVSIARASPLVFAEKLDLRHDLVPEKVHNNALTIVHSFMCESTTGFSKLCQKYPKMQQFKTKLQQQIHNQIMFNWLLVCVKNKVCIFCFVVCGE